MSTKEDAMAEETGNPEFADMITEERGPAWVLVSVSVADEDGFGVKVDVAPLLDLDSVKALLRKTLEAM
jgi:hypothetical protein